MRRIKLQQQWKLSEKEWDEMIEENKDIPEWKKMYEELKQYYLHERPPPIKVFNRLKRIKFKNIYVLIRRAIRKTRWSLKQEWTRGIPAREYFLSFLIDEYKSYRNKRSFAILGYPLYKGFTYDQRYFRYRGYDYSGIMDLEHMNTRLDRFFEKLQKKAEDYLKNKYEVHDGCTIMFGSLGPYRYCDLAIWEPGKYSQRHNVRCPQYCKKCVYEHNDCKGYEKKWKLKKE